MKIPAGKTVAFVGLSGAGKSTLINLLCKFYAPDEGEICLDGEDLQNTTRIFCAEKSVWCCRKIIFSKARSKKTSATAICGRALRKSRKRRERLICTIRSNSLPHKYESDAQQLSGGQQQRIAIARLFLKDPP
jgi:ABC-type multidrug transport system fused ATPase/permease subunit